MIKGKSSVCPKPISFKSNLDVVGLETDPGFSSSLLSSVLLLPLDLLRLLNLDLFLKSLSRLLVVREEEEVVSGAEVLDLKGGMKD